MNHSKTGIRHVVDICYKKGIEHIIISPGSRNAPLIIAFTDHPKIKCHSIVDERSAAFFALGMAQQSQKTVAVACTSGTAALNFAPAIAEAYYQQIPLLVLTADRPEEWIDQADSQTIRQKGIYANYCRKSIQLPQSIHSEDGLWHNDRLICEAIDTCSYPVSGPVHINLPFTEPLYEGFEEEIPDAKIIETLRTKTLLEDDALKRATKIWNTSKRKLIISGMLLPNEPLAAMLHALSGDPSVAVLTETTSNLYSENFNPCIDRIINSLTEKEEEAFAPDLLISIGNQIISKKIKAFLRKNKAAEHWHIAPCDLFTDTFQCLSKNIPLAAEQFFMQLLPNIKKTSSSFAHTWKERDRLTEKRHEEFLSSCRFSDLKAFELILKSIPGGSNLQMGNSTPVRYTQLFTIRRDISYNSNRGTSGIDGVLSTAVGVACAGYQPTTLILGDLSFFYDSNALWNKNLPDNLRIIVINNQGGGIFRFVEGPSETAAFEEFFETSHQNKAEGIARAFNIPYLKASGQQELEEALKKLYNPENKKITLLEVFTPRQENDVLLKEYFRFLKK